MDTSKITNVLIFKDGFYWLTCYYYLPRYQHKGSLTDLNAYEIIEGEKMMQEYGIDKNGFEFASDAYAYIASLNQKKENHITLDMADELQSSGD